MDERRTRVFHFFKHFRGVKDEIEYPTGFLRVVVSVTSLCAVFIVRFPPLRVWETEPVLKEWGPRTGRGVGYCTRIILFREYQKYNGSEGEDGEEPAPGAEVAGYRNIYNATGLTMWQRNATSTERLSTHNRQLPKNDVWKH